MIRTRTFLYAVFCALGLTGFGLIVALLFGRGPESDAGAQWLDRAVFGFFKDHRSPILNHIVTDITALGSFTVLTWFAIGTLGFLTLFRQKLRILELITISAGSAIWPRLLKVYFERARPDIADRLVSVSEYSFPSGHAFGSSAMYLAFGLLAAEILRSKTQKTFCIGFAVITILLIGVSRIYLGVHYTTDVLAGWCLGTTWTFFATLVFDLIRQRSVLTVVSTGD